LRWNNYGRLATASYFHQLGFARYCLSANLVPKNFARPYTPRQAAYDLKKLRGKKMVHKIENLRRYESVPDRLWEMTPLFVLREKVIKLVLAGAGKTRRGPKPKQQS
jgi:hypothetical protein